MMGHPSGPVTPRTWRGSEVRTALMRGLDELGDEVEIVELSAGENMPIRILTSGNEADEMPHVVEFTELLYDGEGWASWPA